MFNLKTKLATAAIAVAAMGSFATPAVAGQCSTAGASDLANAPTMPKGVTDDVIGSINLGSEIKYRYLKWRINRMRRRFDVYSGGRADDVNRRVH